MKLWVSVWHRNFEHLQPENNFYYDIGNNLFEISV